MPAFPKLPQVPRPKIFGMYPENDSFDALTAAPDTTYLTGNYIKFQAFSTGTIVVDATPFWPANIWASGASMQLHNGWFPTQGTGTNTTYVNGGPAAATLQAAADVGGLGRRASLAGFMFRDYMASDVEVNGSFKFSGVPSGLPIGATRTYSFGFALAARLRGTQVSGGATGTIHGSITGYYFGLFGEHSATGAGVTARLRYLLIKISAGVPTVVASANPAGTSAANFLFPPSGSVRTNPDKHLRFRVETVGANVVLTGYSVDSQGVATQVVTYTDTTSPILVTGRSGIIMSVENGESGGTTSSGDQEHLCNWWSVGPIGGNVVLREQWERFHTKGGLAVSPLNVTYPHTLTKHSLLSGWFGDYFCLVNAAGGYTNSVRLDTANNRIKLVPSANSSRVFAFSERLANDPQFQDRQVSITFENTGPTTAREAGIQLFGTLPNVAYTASLSTAPSCYMLTVSYTASGTFDLILYRCRANSTAPVQMVKKTGVAGLALGTAFTLRFYCDTQTVPSVKNGYVRMAAYINGVQQTWDQGVGYYNDAGTLVPSNGNVVFQVQAGGSVIDRKSTRISSGNGQGIHALSAAVATANVFFDAWTAGVGDAPYEDPETEQASVTVPAENDAATGTFSVPYDWGTQEQDDWRVRDHRFDSDHRYVAVAQGRPRRRWSLGNEAATASEVSTLKAFWASHKGVEVPFSWTTPKGEAVTVRFAVDRLAVEQVTPAVFRWSAVFEEVLSE